MRWSEGFIAVDWGTTNRRAYHVGSDGRCTAEFEDNRGALSIARGEFPAAVREIADRLGDRPLLLAGMAGSTLGWMDAPYVACPAGLAEVTAGIVWPEPERAAIVPGVSFVGGDHADIMRGEEVQILGAAAAGTIPADCLVCHPGTHNKWVVVAQGRIRSFKTVMTGEMFNLLRDRSILAEHLAHPVSIGDAFHFGVRRGLGEEALTAELFAIRAKSLLGKLPPEDGASFASGLLIGRDVRFGLGGAGPGEIFVMGRPELTALYSAAIRAVGRETQEIDGESAFLAGASKIAELLQ